jgi:hypothetical protein
MGFLTGLENLDDADAVITALLTPMENARLNHLVIMFFMNLKMQGLGTDLPETLMELTEDQFKRLRQVVYVMLSLVEINTGTQAIDPMP